MANMVRTDTLDLDLALELKFERGLCQGKISGLLEFHNKKLNSQ